jgi:hypothetical protein
MNKASILKVAGVATAACFLVCEPVPQNSISDAHAALEKAEKSGAQAWAPAQLRRGHTLYDSAMKVLSVEKRKLPFKRNYKEVIHLLDIAAEAGNFALESQQAANGRMKELLDRAKGIADSLDTQLKAAAAKKMDVAHLQAALDSAKTAQKEALAVLNNGDMLLAEEKAAAASNKTEEVARSTAGLLSHQKK